MSTLPQCNCSTFRSITLTFTPPATAPANGYRVRWRSVIDDTVTPNIVTPYTESYSQGTGGTITINAVPKCCKIEGDITASCAAGQFGLPSTFVVQPTATYQVTFASVSCNNGIGVYTVTGTPGQTVKLRLEFGGSIQHNGVNGTCAYLFGKIEYGSLSGQSNSYSTAIGSTGPTVVNLIYNPEISVVIPSQGYINVQTTLVAYNVVSVSSVSGTLRVASIDNQTISNISYSIPCLVANTNSNPPCGVAQ